MTAKAPPSLLRKFARLNLPDALLLAEAMTSIMAAAIIIRLTPFPVLGRLASWPIRRPVTDKAKRETMIDDIIWALSAAAKRSPFRAMCFECGLTAQTMLRRRGVNSVLYFGVAPGQKKALDAHVWVIADDTNVTGAGIAHQYATLAQFPADEQPRLSAPAR